MSNKITFPQIKISNHTVYSDSRGYFFESYNKDKDFLSYSQTNVSYSVKNTIRGIHLQLEPYEQGKNVTVLQGKIYDVQVDLRKGSDTFGKYQGVTLEKNQNIFIPRGFGHSFLALEDSLILYKVTAPYNKEKERTIIFNDPTIGIDWNIENPIISEKDLRGIRLKDL